MSKSAGMPYAQKCHAIVIRECQCPPHPCFLCKLQQLQQGGVMLTGVFMNTDMDDDDFPALSQIMLSERLAARMPPSPQSKSHAPATHMPTSFPAQTTFPAQHRCTPMHSAAQDVHPPLSQIPLAEWPRQAPQRLTHLQQAPQQQQQQRSFPRPPVGHGTAWDAAFPPAVLATMAQNAQVRPFDLS